MDLREAYPAILTILAIGLVLGLGIYIMATVRTEVATTYTGTDDNVNATTDLTTLGDSTADDYALSGITTVINHTGDTIPSTNYSTTVQGTINWTDDLTDALLADADAYLNISSTYTYDKADSPEEAINDSLEGLGDFADWIAIIVVVIAAAIVLGIVISSFGNKPGV